MTKWILLLVSLTSFTALADISVMPVVGMERIQKYQPEEYTSNRFYYGVRFIAGQPLLSLEAEVTQAKDDKTFTHLDKKLNDETTNAQLGIRSTFGKGALSFYLRFGGSASQSKLTTTTISTGVDTVEEPDIVVNPYAGTGLVINVANMFKLNAGITAIFAGSPKGSDVDYRAVLGYSIAFSKGR